MWRCTSGGFSLKLWWREGHPGGANARGNVASCAEKPKVICFGFFFT